MADDTLQRAPFSRLTLDDLEILSAKAQGLIEAARDAAVEPNRRKVLRRFSATECLQYLGNISIDTLYRRLKKDEHLPQGVQVSTRRREFTLAEIHTLQHAFGIAPRRPPGKSPVVVSICNFKGGVAKTTTTAHLAQYLCLHGYRVLAVDLDRVERVARVAHEVVERDVSAGGQPSCSASSMMIPAGPRT